MPADVDSLAGIATPRVTQSPRDYALDHIAPFIVSDQMVGLMRRFSWNHRHRHLARWRRSLRKRFGSASAAPPPEPALVP